VVTSEVVVVGKVKLILPKTEVAVVTAVVLSQYEYQPGLAMPPTRLAKMAKTTARQIVKIIIMTVEWMLDLLVVQMKEDNAIFRGRWEVRSEC
jgi:hypothetical protein